MRKETAVVRNPNGIHLRVAGQVAQAAKRFNVDIAICKGCEKADGCSLFQLLLLEAIEGSEIEITVDGEREDEALDELRCLLGDKGQG